MAAGYLVIKVPIKSLVQQSDGRLLAYRTRWSAWYGLPHSFPHICAGNYSLDVKHPQMSHLKRGCMSPAHFEGNHLPPSSSPSFSTLGVRMDNGLATGQPEPGDTSGREIRRSEWEEGNRHLKWMWMSEEEKSRGQGQRPPICQPLWSTHHFKPKLTHLSWNVNI